MKIYSLDDLHFVETSNSRHMVEAQELITLAQTSMEAFCILFNFFINHPNNSSTVPDIELELEFEKEDYEHLYDKEINETIFGKLKDGIIKLHTSGFNKQDYSKVLSLFQEFLVKEWKSRSNQDTKVFEEPKIRYKRQIIFKRKKYRHSKCDIVCINKKEKSFEAYECKTTMKMFYGHLTSKAYTATKKAEKKGIMRAKRKQNYMSGLLDLLSKKFFTNKVSVEYATFFASNDLPSSIGKIPVFSLQSIPFNKLFEIIS